MRKFEFRNWKFENPYNARNLTLPAGNETRQRLTRPASRLFAFCRLVSETL
jgi:hypothetical protein